MRPSSVVVHNQARHRALWPSVFMRFTPVEASLAQVLLESAICIWSA